ncbi:MAG: hypothetical protein FJ110_04595 [Deltaproteobacteria bacterium]|nr:hypothetical protein [Deltaproteobacteria bacterium]
MEENFIAQLGVTLDEGKFYIVEKPFFLQVVDGPLQRVEKGWRLLLSQRFGDEMFFSGRVIPVELGEHFEAVRDFQVIQNGEYFRVKKGDTLKLTKDEAVQFLRTGDVREKRGGFENES